MRKKNTISRHKRNSPYSSSNSRTISFNKKDNRFATLHEMDISHPPADIAPHRPPPVILRDATTVDAQTFLAMRNIVPFSMKNMSTGVKVVLNTQIDYDNFIAASRGHKQIFSYADRNSRMQKFTLSGLTSMDISTLKLELKRVGIIPHEVIEMKLPRNRYTSEAIYLLYFSKETPTTLQQLKKTETINYIVVTWGVYTPRFKSHTQCRNCQVHGHGSSHCFSTVVCMYCAKAHKTEECPNVNIPNLFKCANCTGIHWANSPDCPSRLKYLQIRQDIAQKRHPKPKHQNQSKDKPEYVPAPAPPPLTRSFSSIAGSSRPPGFPSPNTQRNHTSSGSSPSQHLPPAFDPNEPMLSAAEITAMLRDIIPRLKACRTRQDQINATIEICIQYACSV